jgi:hypothetical protein
LREFTEVESKAVEVIVNSKEEISQDFFLDFVQEFGLWIEHSSQMEPAQKNLQKETPEMERDF